jgi:hypothetical protein
VDEVNLTLETLKICIGKPVEGVLSDLEFNSFAFERSVSLDVDPPRIDYVFKEHGIALTCNLDDRVRTIFLERKDDERFGVDLTDLPLSLSREGVRDHLGAPFKSGGLINDPILGDFGPWDRFDNAEHLVHVEYHKESDRIRMITVMSADWAP